MLAKRIIPCLDIKNGRTVKGINFIDIRDAGDPVTLAVSYGRQGADELVLLDITATIERRKTFSSLVNAVAAAINIPFTVGGGIATVADVEILLKNGADKIAVNSAAFRNPVILQEMSRAFGSQCVVVAIDTKREGDGNWYVYLNGGRLATGVKTTEWADKAVQLGAGEILLTSMDHDGTKSGFACEITSILSDLLSVPVIASGGAGSMEHFAEVFSKGKADAALAASVFHYGEIGLSSLKGFLAQRDIPVRL